jgi:hypothetical protein
MDETRQQQLFDLLEREARAGGASNVEEIKRAFVESVGWSFNNPHAEIDDENVKRFVAHALKR